MQHHKLDQTVVDTLRTLSIDMIDKANSGHPGMPMGAAPMAYTLFSQHICSNPTNPNWFNRDRFVLSAGHGSALLYSILHLFGFKVSIKDLQSFRQLKSLTPGHPEYNWTPGIDATTGPLGQGVAMAVGMALAENHLAAQYNQPNYALVDHHTYAICGDGDLMEGVSAEAASLAGHLGLGKLVVLYDSNNICLDGDLNATFSEDVAARFRAYGWEVLRVEDGNNLTDVNAAIAQAKKSDDKPTLIEVKTIIGYGSPNKAGSSSSHGAPLGEKETLATKAQYNWPHTEKFHVPQKVYDYLANYKTQGEKAEATWNKLVEEYSKGYPELAAQFKRVLTHKLPENWSTQLPDFSTISKMATRSASGRMINALADQFPEFFGGSADLGCSNKTFIDNSTAYSRTDHSGKNIWFGVREFAMGAILNGMALHAGLKVFGATFFVFSDYLRPAIRLAALMQLPVTYIFTHDSIAVGEDGPTHEPIEHLASLRAMPGLTVIRPADAKETKAAWKRAITNTTGPIALVLSRQDLPVLNLADSVVCEGVSQGGYIVSAANKVVPDAILIATGSEVSLAIEAQAALAQQSVDVSVVSLPSWELFNQTDKAYQESVLPSSVSAKLAIEAGSTFGWREFVGSQGYVLGIDHFGDSAPAQDLFKAYGFTTENITQRVKKLLNNQED